MNLGAFHQAYNNKKATEHAIKNFRKFYPQSPYFLFSDHGLDFSDIAEKYNCYYQYCDYRIGYDKCFGFGKEGSQEWLNRFYTACLTLNSDYVIMMEDDVLIQNEIFVSEEVEFCKLYIPTNKFPSEFIQYLTTKYSAIFHDDWYGSGGGSIFKSSTFIDNYQQISTIFKEEYDYIIENLNVNFGWVDNFMTTFYYMCGKQYTPNPHLTEVTTNPNWKNPYFAIVHQYKKFYET
jgi:hypothetical protein